jgi:hypothetical protein
MTTNYFKQETVTPPAQITHGAHKQQKLESVVYSYDNNVSKLIIPVALPNGMELDFKEVETIKVLLTVTQDDQIKKIEDTAVIEKSHRRHISYILTDRLKGYAGKVKMNVYLDLKNGQQIDLAEYGFTMVRSAIDDDMPEIEDFYFKSLDDVITELKLKAENAWHEIAGDLSELTGSVNAVGDKVEQLSDKADEISEQLAKSDFRSVILGKEMTIDGNANFIGKVKGSIAENPHVAYFSQTADVPNPPINTGEISTANYTNIATNDGKLIAPSVNVATRRMSLVAQFDVVSDIDRNNPGLFDALGATTQDQKVAVTRKLVDGTISPVVYASGSGASTTDSGASKSQVNMQIWIGSLWQGGLVNPNDQITLLRYKNQTGQRVQDDGCVYIVLYAPPSDGVVPSVINIDQVYLDYQVNFKMSDVFVAKTDQFTPALIVAATAGADDLNKYTKAGYYLCRTNVYATNLLNTPVNMAFKLEVQELISANNTPGVNQLLTTYHTSNTSFRRFTRNLYNGVWSMWREIPFADQVQLSKVTADDRNSLFKAGDNDTILGKIVEIGAGVYNGEGTGKTADSPNANNVRLLVNMVVSSAGSVLAIDSQGNAFTRAISGSAWRGEWQPMISKVVFDELEKRLAALESKVK